MSSVVNVTTEAIEKQYELIKQYYQKFLKKFGVKLPTLRNGKGELTKNSLVLVYLSFGYPKTRVVSKIELTNFIRKFDPNVPDVQQGRHLAAQDGWWIVSGGRDNIVLKVPSGYYQLYTLEAPYPDFKQGHRLKEIKGWDELKLKYHNRCATCGSEEGKPHLHWSGTKTSLQQSHLDPRKPLKPGNIIPQCQKCNRADRNRWVYDEKGRVIKLAYAKFVLNFDEDIQQRIYQILNKKYGGSKRK